MPDWTYTTDEGIAAASADKSTGETYYAETRSDGSKYSAYALNADGTLKWKNTYNISEGGDIEHVGSYVVLSDTSNTVKVLNASDGTEKWTFPDGGALLGINENRVLVGNGATIDEVDLVNETVTQVWSTSDFISGVSSLAYNGDYVFIGTTNGQVYVVRDDFQLVDADNEDFNNAGISELIAVGPEEIYGTYIESSFDKPLFRLGWNSSTERVIGFDWSVTGDEMEGISYDAVDNHVHIGSSDFGARRFSPTGEELYQDTGGSDMKTLVHKEGTKSIVTDGTSIAQYDDEDSYWTQLFPEVTATHTSVSTTVNTAYALDYLLIESSMNTARVTAVSQPAQQVSATSTMVSPASVNISLDASQSVTGASMNVADLLVTVAAENYSAEVTLSDARATDENTPWVLVDSDGVRHKATMVEYTESVPVWRRGQEFTETFIFDEEDADETYSKLKSEYGRYLREETVNVFKDYRGTPKYTQNLNQNSVKNDYLFKVEPNPKADMENFWCVVTDISDATRVAEGGKSLTITMIPLEPSEVLDKRDIQRTYEVSI